MQRDAEPVEEGRGGRLGKGLQGCTQTLKNQSVQSLGIKRAYKQDGGKPRAKRSDQGGHLGQGGKACK